MLNKLKLIPGFLLLAGPALAQYAVVPSTSYPALETVLNAKPAWTSGAGAPTSNCTTWLDAYFNTTSQAPYLCTATNTWSLWPAAAGGITYTDPATGAVAETQGTVNLESKSVTRFGAKCDNSTDDSTALQAAINWLMAGSGELTSPTGATCKFSTPLYYNWTTASTNYYAPKRLNLQGGTWAGSVGANKIGLTLNVNGAGHVTSSGTTVTWVDGAYFHQGLVGKTITVNGAGLTVASVTNAVTLVTTGSSTNASPVVYKTGNTSTIVRDLTIENGQISDVGGTANLANMAFGGSDPADGNYYGNIFLNNLWCYAVGGDCIDVENAFESAMYNVNMQSTVFTGYGLYFTNGNGNQTGEWYIARTSTRQFLHGYQFNGINGGSIYEMTLLQPIALQAYEYGIYINNGDGFHLFEAHVEDAWNGNCNSVVNAQYPGIYFVSGGVAIGAEGINDNPGTIGMTCMTGTFGQQSAIWTYNISGFQTELFGGKVYQMNGTFADVNGSGGVTSLFGVPSYVDISGGSESIALFTNDTTRSKVFSGPEITVPTCAAAAIDCVYADSTQHGFLASFNNAGYLPLVQGPASNTAGHLATFSGTNGGKIIDGGLTIPACSTNGTHSAGYTTVLSDAGCFIMHPTADNSARTFTIDSNANVAFPVGTMITFVNQINTLSIAITSDTMTLAGTATTGTRTCAAGCVATAIKVTTTAWFISGAGLT